MTEAHALSMHRIQALTGGIDAAAMTSLVVDLDVSALALPAVWQLMILLGRIGRRIEAQPETNP